MKYAIYTMFDNDYVENAEVFLYSFFKTNTWFNGDLNIINDEKWCILSDENKEKIQKISDKIKILDLNYKEYESVFKNQYEICNKRKIVCCFYKLEIFRGNYDKIVWIDSDVCILGSLEDLFENPIFDGKFCACLDCVPSTNVHIKRGPKDYFNGGVYRVDRELIKKYPYDKVFNVCANVTKEELSQSEKSRLNGNAVDQDVLNYYIENEDVLIIPSTEYNINHSFGRIDMTNAKICHYYGPFNKPNGPMDKDGRDGWFFDPWHKIYNEINKKLGE